MTIKCKAVLLNKLIIGMAISIGVLALILINNPIGIAEYELTQSIPDNLKGDLPSIEELERELER